jgi:hypothetical protein
MRFSFRWKGLEFAARLALAAAGGKHETFQQATASALERLLFRSYGLFDHGLPEKRTALRRAYVVHLYLLPIWA